MPAKHPEERTRPAQRPGGPSRRQVLAWGTALLPASLLWSRAVRAQRITEAPLAPNEARGDLEHRFWKDLLDAFPLEPEENHLNNAEIGIPPLQSLARIADVARDVSAHADSTASGHVANARLRAARFWGAEAHEMSFAPDATDAMRRIAESLPLEPGAVVAISSAEPSSSLLPWQALQRQQRVRIQRFETHDDDGSRRNPRKWVDGARVVVLSHVLPTTGALLPLDEVCDEARRRNIWVVANGSHAAGIVPVDVHASGVDAYVASGSGWMLGPRGTALLYVRKELLATLVLAHRPPPPGAAAGVLGGGAGVHAARELEMEPPNASLVAGLATSLEWLDGIGIQTVREHAVQLSMRIYERLSSESGIDVLSSEESIRRCPIVTLRVRRRPNAQVTEWLRGNLTMYVHRIDTAGLNAIRVSPYVVNRPAEVDWFIDGMRALA